MIFPGGSLFGGGVKTPAAPPPPPTPEDPAILDARKKLRESQLRRRGRAASILTSGEGVLGETNVNRPTAGTLGG